MTTPEASRPYMPGYDLPDADAGAGLLPWRWAEERLEAARNYWVATTRPDGRPHAMPVWGIWMDGSLIFSSSVTSRKTKNLATDPRCTVTTERADEAVIVEGRAAVERDEARLRRWAAAYQRKYDWEMDPGQPGVYRVVPRVAFGFIERPDQFAATATRWTFGAP